MEKLRTDGFISAALSFDATPVRLSQYLPTIPDTHSIVVFVGAMAHGYVQLQLMLQDSRLTPHFSDPTTLRTTWSTRRLPSQSTLSVQVSPAERYVPPSPHPLYLILTSVPQFCCAVEDLFGVL